MDETVKRIGMSQEIGDLAAALSKAQAAIKGAVEDADNPFFKSKYANLSSVWEACRDQLTSNGIAVVQSPSADGPRVTVTTVLTHSSGQWMSGELTVQATKADPQGIGSAITYARRYALAAMVGVAPASDDDDGNASSEPRGKPQNKSEPPPKTQRASKPAAAPPTEKGNTIQHQLLSLLNGAIGCSTDADRDLIVRWVCVNQGGAKKYEKLADCRKTEAATDVFDALNMLNDSGDAHFAVMLDRAKKWHQLDQKSQGKETHG